jgi:hypothetical protein
VRQGIRDRSETLATERLGWRKEAEILASRGHAIERIQFTELDRALLRRADPHRMITDRALAPEYPGQAEYRHQERRRLAFLEQLGLAEPVSRHAWQLSPSLEATLRQAQRTTDVIKSRDRHGAWLANPHLPVGLTHIEPGMTLTGRVVGTGLADELRDRRYLLLEGEDRIHYIVQSAAIERARGAGDLRVGQRITLAGHAVTLDSRRVLTLDIRTHSRGGPERMAPEPARAERTMRWPTLDMLQRAQGRPIQPAGTLPGLVYRGRLVTYATDAEGGRHAVLDTGRELTAIPVSRASLAAGRHVRASARQVDDENRSRRQLVWRLSDDERIQMRQRGHA